MTIYKLSELQEAASVLDEYIDKHIRHNSGQSWWRDHDGCVYSGDTGYFLEMWEDILNSLGVNEGRDDND